MNLLGNCIRFRRSWRRLWKLLVLGYVLLTCGMFVAWYSYSTAWIPNLSGDPHRYHLKGVHIHDHATKEMSREPPLRQRLVCHVSGYNYFLKSQVTLDDPLVCDWMEHSSVTGEGSMVVYGTEMAVLKNVVIRPELASGRKGGEDMNQVLNQAEEAEYLKLEPGYFSLPCKEGTHTKQSFRTNFGNNYLNDWANSVACLPSNESIAKGREMKGLTIALQRFEYVNLYHTMCDFFNTFLMLMIFNPDPKQTTVLWVDGHPKGGLDDTWETLFGETKRSGWLEGPTRFQNLVWSPQGYHSPLNFHEKAELFGENDTDALLPRKIKNFQVPYLEQFREFFLSRFGVPREKTLECSRLNVLVIFRRDYVAHPRNPQGLVKRKIHNEAEVMSCLRETFPTDAFTDLQLDKLSFKEQLQAVMGADVLIGMHGAGLSHALFLPRHGGLIELYPNYWPQANRHFRAMAHWRRLHYDTWQNQDPHLEKPDYSTVIPPRILNDMYSNMKKKMCPFAGLK